MAPRPGGFAIWLYMLPGVLLCTMLCLLSLTYVYGISEVVLILVLSTCALL